MRHESSSASTNWTEFPGQPEITKKNFHISFGSCVICGLHCILFLYLCVLESWFNCLLLNRRKPLRLKQAEIRIKLQFQLECHLAWKKARVPNLSNGFVKCYKSQCLFTFSEYKQRYIRLFIEQIVTKKHLRKHRGLAGFNVKLQIRNVLSTVSINFEQNKSPHFVKK